MKTIILFFFSCMAGMATDKAPKDTNIAFVNTFTEDDVTGKRVVLSFTPRVPKYAVSYVPQKNLSLIKFHCRHS